MKQFFIILFILPFTFLQAQTKKIAFKSHSGSAENFAIALENDLFDMDGSNFGQAPEREIKSAQLDSVIFVSDSVTLLVTSVYCTMRYAPKDNAELWRAGREVALYHPLFSKKHSLDSIKRVIKEHYNFKNPVEKTIFVGFDNNIPPDSLCINPATLITYKKAGNQGGFDMQIACILIGIFMVSVLSGLLNRKSKRDSLAKEIV
jgi:hypothetical protein